jgi:hypothetical protein
LDGLELSLSHAAGGSMAFSFLSLLRSIVDFELFLGHSSNFVDVPHNGRVIATCGNVRGKEGLQIFEKLNFGHLLTPLGCWMCLM